MSAMGEGEGPNAPGEGPPLFIPRLTTTFTPHASCLAPTFTLPPRGVDRVSSDEDLSLTMATRGLEADCYPPYFAPLSEASVSTSTNVSVTFYPAPYYSPGICPHAYTAVSQQVDSSGVATSTCCPESYSLDKDIDASTWDCAAFLTSVVFLNGSFTTPATGADVTASAITIVNAPSDSTLFLASSTSPLSRTTAVTSRPSTGVPVATSPAATQSAPLQRSGITTGAQAGIGVGVTMGVVGLLLTIFFAWRRWRWRIRNTSNPQHETSTFDKAELSGEGKDLPQLDHGNPVYEANAETKPPEMATDTILAELDGNWRGWEAPGAARR